MINEIIEKIEAYDQIVIHRHQRPDPDAIGSQAGLRALIKAHYPHKTVMIVGEEEPSLTFMARMDQVEDDFFEDALAIICDTANLARIDDARFRQAKEHIKIDHHPNEEPYGDIHWVDTHASSTSEMIFELFLVLEKKGATLNEEIARLLFAGIVGDTGRFQFPNTSDRTFQFASRLVQVPFSRTALYHHMYEKSYEMTKLEGYVLSHIELRPSGAAFVKLTQDNLKEFNVTANETSAIVNSFATLKGLKAWVFFIEDSDDLIRIRFRSKGPVINKLAQKYNGGGHPLASGASIRSWEEMEAVIRDLDDVCLKYEQ